MTQYTKDPAEYNFLFYDGTNDQDLINAGFQVLQNLGDNSKIIRKYGGYGVTEMPLSSNVWVAENPLQDAPGDGIITAEDDNGAPLGYTIA